MLNYIGTYYVINLEIAIIYYYDFFIWWELFIIFDSVLPSFIAIKLLFWFLFNSVRWIHPVTAHILHKSPWWMCLFIHRLLSLESLSRKIIIVILRGSKIFAMRNLMTHTSFTVILSCFPTFCHCFEGYLSLYHFSSSFYSNAYFSPKIHWGQYLSKMCFLTLILKYSLL